MITKFFGQFLDWVIYFSDVELHVLLVYFGDSLSVISFAIIFSHSEGCLFTLLLKAFKFNQTPLVYFCFYFHYFRTWVIEDLALIYVVECSAYVFL